MKVRNIANCACRKIHHIISFRDSSNHLKFLQEFKTIYS